MLLMAWTVSRYSTHCRLVAFSCNLDVALTSAMFFKVIVLDCTEVELFASISARTAFILYMLAAGPVTVRSHHLVYLSTTKIQVSLLLKFPVVSKYSFESFKFVAASRSLQ